MDETKQIFTQILNNLSEKEMKTYINKYCKTNKAMVNKFISLFAHKIEGNCEKKFNIIIDTAIEACLNRKSRFVIDPRKTNSALRPVFKILKEEQNSYHEKPYESLVLVQIIIKNFVGLIEYFYVVHKFDIIDDLFIQTLDLLKSIYHSNTTPYEFKDEIFDYVLKISQEEIFNTFSTYMDMNIDLRLLKIVTSLNDNEKNIKILELVEKKIGLKKENSKEKIEKFKSELQELIK